MWGHIRGLGTGSFGMRLASGWGATRMYPDRKFSKLRTAVHPSNIAPIGTKLWENAFQTIPDVSFSNLEKKILISFFSKISVKFCVETQILEELWIFERHRQIRLEKWPPINLISALYDFWRRGKSGTNDFFAQFSAKNEPKKLQPCGFLDGGQKWFSVVDTS